LNNYTHARRLRNSPILRESLNDISIEVKNLIVPVFLVHGTNIKEEIESLPQVYHLSIDRALNEISNYLELGLNKILVFGIPEKKDYFGTSASDPNEIVPLGIKSIKDKFGDKILIFADVCLCAYTLHGHCGIPDKNGLIQNELSLKYISEAALNYAKAGSDFVAPSDMMDGRIQAIRKILDNNNLSSIGILSYAVKFASSYYGPFRDAAHSSPQFGDRQSYQLSQSNSRIALREIQLDEEEGADMVMVKPALAYLDIIYQVRKITNLPIVAYNVSGEYSQVKFAGKAGVIDEYKIVIENLTAMKRSGADLIITYHAIELAEKGLVT
jgi:porphobilinogen synthase